MRSMSAASPHDGAGGYGIKARKISCSEGGNK